LAKDGAVRRSERRRAKRRKENMVRGAIDKGSNRFFPISEERSHEEGSRFSIQEWMDRSLFLHEDKGKPLRSRVFLAATVTIAAHPST
jgi:hypothetical protein